MEASSYVASTLKPESNSFLYGLLCCALLAAELLSNPNPKLLLQILVHLDEYDQGVTLQSMTLQT